MPESVVRALTLLAQALEITGAGALVFGFVVVSLRALSQASSIGATKAVEHYRRSIARVVVGGLEVLVAATVIKTLTLDPTMESLGMLAVMIAIRTILAWTMSVEISGRWPWQARQPGTGRD